MQAPAMVCDCACFYLLACSLTVSGHSSWHFLTQCWRDQPCQKLSPVWSLTTAFLAFLFFLLLGVEDKATGRQVDMNWVTRPPETEMVPGMFYLVGQMQAQRVHIFVIHRYTKRQKKKAPNCRQHSGEIKGKYCVWRIATSGSFWPDFAWVKPHNREQHWKSSSIIRYYLQIVVTWSKRLSKYIQYKRNIY